MKKQYPDSITKLGGPTEKEVTFKFLLELHLENKKSKMTTRENKAEKFLALGHCTLRDDKGGKYRLRITFSQI